MNKDQQLKEFFAKYNFNIDELSLKEQKRILKSIVDNAKLEQDLTEIRYHKNPSNYLPGEYVEQMEGFYMNQLYANEQILKIRYIERKNRLCQIKSFFQKVKRINR